MSPLETIRTRYPDAFVEFDRTAWDCGYHRPWMVWSHNDSDMRLLGDGKTEQEALQQALQEMGL